MPKSKGGRMICVRKIELKGHFSTPNRFDLNLLLDLDILKPHLEFTLWEGFVRIKRRPPSPSFVVPQQHRFAPILADLQRKLFDDKWFLDVDRVKKWTQGIVSKILPKIQFPRNITEVSARCAILVQNEVAKMLPIPRYESETAVRRRTSKSRIA